MNTKQALSIIEKRLMGERPADLAEALNVAREAEAYLRANGDGELAEYVADRVYEAERQL